MTHRRLRVLVAATAIAAALAIPGVASAHSGPAGFVYTETNAAAGNSIMAFARTASGQLNSIGSFSTHGAGTGAGLATQGEVVLSADGDWLLAVNAGSNDVSLFRVRDNGTLAFSDKAAAGGTDPVSVTTYGHLAYVLDAGGAGNIAGFRIDDGRLHPIAGSTRPLSGSATNPAEIAFSTNGRFLVVTERATNMLDVYAVRDGRAGTPVTSASSGPVPYGFAFDLRNHPIVSEAANSTLSSYRLGSSGATVISASVSTGGIAACWVTVTPNGRWAFDSNAHGGTVSSFSIASNGAIALVHSVAANTGTGSAPLDLGVTTNGRLLYVYLAGTHTIAGYWIGTGATLTAISGGPVLPASASGLAVS
jgi:6-phosphogluconolactonase (cycloisomerase 2 family)